MNVKISEGGKCPLYAEPSAAGMDMYASKASIIEPGRVGKVQTNVAVEIPDGYYGALVGRSGLASKGILAHYGTIDSSYRGNIAAILYNTTDEPFQVRVGDRICQLIVQPYIHAEFELVEELSETVRNTGGFGSSGI